MCASGWTSNCAAIESASAAIWMLRVRRTATNASVVAACASASPSMVPRGEAASRWCLVSPTRSPPSKGTSITDIAPIADQVRDGPHGPLPIRIYLPDESTASGIGLVCLHGGGWVWGGPDDFEAD
jgi:acetyl esterase/lipase